MAREQEHGDAIFAQTLASQSHDLSESEEEVVEVNRDEEVPVREVVDLDSDVEDVGKDEGSSPQKMGMCCYYKVVFLYRYCVLSTCRISDVEVTIAYMYETMTKAVTY